MTRAASTAIGIPMLPDPDPGAAYSLSVDEADFLAQVAAAAPVERRALLGQFARQRGQGRLVDLFAEFLALSLSVSANAREFAGLVLLEHEFDPYRADLPNLPSIDGALRGVANAALCATEATCGGCAFRLGTQANQSRITSMDASDAADGEFEFSCHEDLDARGEPTRKCVGWAAATKLRLEVQASIPARAAEQEDWQGIGTDVPAVPAGGAK